MVCGTQPPSSKAEDGSAFIFYHKRASAPGRGTPEGALLPHLQERERPEILGLDSAARRAGALNLALRADSPASPPLSP